jgi:hypothetical protein
MKYLRSLVYAAAALCQVTGTAAADSTSTGECKLVVEDGHSRMICNSNVNLGLGLPQAGNPNREEVTYTRKPTAAPEPPPRTDNFCGRGYRMAPGGCLPVRG